jgi:ubiquinone biosynthesis protein COQ4
MPEPAMRLRFELELERAMHGDMAAYDPSTLRQVFLTIRNFLVTVWNPARSDIRQGINSLIFRALRDSNAAQIEQRRSESPELSRLYEEGYDPDIQPALLEKLPDGTLGREYVRFIRDNGIDPLGQLLALGTPANFIEYSFRRGYKLHDVLHVVLGCDASILGEVRIVSYSLGQAREQARFAPAMALLVLFLHLALRRPWQIPAAIRLSRQWRPLGAGGKPYTGFRLEDWVDRPVAEVRRMVVGEIDPLL